MNPRLRRVAALAAALAPTRAERLFAFLAAPADAAAAAAALARAGREERLSELAACLALPDARLPSAHPLVRRMARERAPAPRSKTFG